MKDPLISVYLTTQTVLTSVSLLSLFSKKFFSLFYNPCGLLVGHGELGAFEGTCKTSMSLCEINEMSLNVHENLIIEGDGGVLDIW